MRTNKSSPAKNQNELILAWGAIATPGFDDDKITTTDGYIEPYSQSFVKEIPLIFIHRISTIAPQFTHKFFPPFPKSATIVPYVLRSPIHRRKVAEEMGGGKGF